MFSIKEMLNIGWEKTKKHFWFFVGVELFTFVFIIAVGMISAVFSNSRPILGFAMNIFSIILQMIFGIGFLRIAFEILEDRKPSFQMLFSEMRLFWKYLGASLLVSLLSFGPLIMIIILGKSFLALEVFPILFVAIISVVLGIFAAIFAVIMNIRFQFATYFVVDKAHGPMESLKESFKATQGETLNLICLGIVLGLLNLLGAIVFMVGLLVTVPITILALVATYKKLSVR